MYSPNRLANTFSGQQLSNLYLTNSIFASSVQAQKLSKDLKSQIVLRTTSSKFPVSQGPSTHKKISWSDAKTIHKVGEEYCKKIVSSESKKSEKIQLKKQKILKNNEIIEKIKAEENESLALKISKLNEDFYNKAQKILQDALWKVTQDKTDHQLNIQKSIQESRNTVNNQSSKIISEVFPIAFQFKPTSPKSHSSLASKSQLRLQESYEALSKSALKVEKIKTKLVKNI